MENIYYHFNTLSDEDIVNETYNYIDAMNLIKDVILVETGNLRFIEISDTFNTELVLFNEDDEYMLMYKQDYENDDYTQLVQGNKYYIFHWITSFLNPECSRDEIDILGE